MKIKYYISLKPCNDNRHYIHSEKCPLLPSPEKRLYLGRFLSPEEAVKAAGKYFENNGYCRFCQIAAVKKINRLIQVKLPGDTGFISSEMIICTGETFPVCCIN